jgi:Domain of unknown function (DUF4375)
MTSPRRITQQQRRKDPHAAWNEFVNLLAMSDYADLTPKQRLAHLVFWYESEVQNGGHLQYFENQGVDRVKEVIDALKRLHADCQAKVLSRAAKQYARRPRPPIESVQEYVDVALEAEFDEFDQAFHKCEPSLVDALKAYLAENRSDFTIEVD